MYSRHLKTSIERQAAHFPVIAVTGPRQSGKTTLVRAVFADKPYVSLEDPVERAFAQEDPRGFLARFTHGAIFDEAQRWPDLFSFLQGVVDADRRPGRFVLTGSQQFGLLSGISQSLAGRVGLNTLLPFAWGEIPAPQTAAMTLNDAMLRGGYPQLHISAVPTRDWMASYVATYLERDVRQVLNVQDLSAFSRFLRLCAGRTGQLLKLSSLADETGVSQSTARAWLSVLEASYVVHLLPPYHRNFGKRLVKMPKLYFLDTGLAAWLLGIHTAEQLATHPVRGALFENWVVAEALKSRYNAGRPSDLYFWRDNNGAEADLMFETPQGLQTVEIKSGQTVTSDSIRAGLKSKRMVKAPETAALTPWLVHGGVDAYERGGVRVMGWRHMAFDDAA